MREAIAPNTPVNDDWLVKGPTPVAVTLSGVLTYVTGDPELLVSSAANRLRGLFADKSAYAEIRPLQIGQDVTLSLLTHVVMGVDGVKSVRWTTPVADIVVDKSGMAVLESLSLSAVQAEEA